MCFRSEFTWTLLVPNIHRRLKYCPHYIQNKESTNRKKQKAKRAATEGGRNVSIRTETYDTGNATFQISSIIVKAKCLYTNLLSRCCVEAVNPSTVFRYSANARSFETIGLIYYRM